MGSGDIVSGREAMTAEPGQGHTGARRLSLVTQEVKEMVKGPWGPPEIHLEITLLHNFQRGRWMGSIKCSQDWGAATV